MKTHSLEYLPTVTRAKTLIDSSDGLARATKAQPLHSRPENVVRPTKRSPKHDHDPGSDKHKSEPVISKAIQALLDRHGVLERKRLGALEAAAGMGYPQVRRRMNGETPWNVNEIQRLASHFGKPVFKLLGALVDDAGQLAVIQVGAVKLPCSMWPGDQVEGDKGIGPLVAVPGDWPGQWIVLPLADAGDRPIYEIKRLIFEAAAPSRVAVVDDDDLTSAIVQFLRKNGLDAISYNKAEHLRAALETTSFDGYTGT